MACMNYMRATGMSYPKACEECGLGPCRYPQHVKAAPEVKRDISQEAWDSLPVEVKLEELSRFLRKPSPSLPKDVIDKVIAPAPEVKYPYYTAAELELIRQAGGPPPPGAMPEATSQPPLKKWQPRVVQIASVHGNLHVLYDDGELWMSRNDGTWRRLALPR